MRTELNLANKHGQPYIDIKERTAEQTWTAIYWCYINVESQDIKKREELGVSCQFALFIEQILFDEPVSGKFDCYGLFKTATAHWFD